MDEPRIDDWSTHLLAARKALANAEAAAALRNYGLAKTEAERAYDAITRLRYWFAVH